MRAYTAVILISIAVTITATESQARGGFGGGGRGGMRGGYDRGLGDRDFNDRGYDRLDGPREGFNDRGDYDQTRAGEVPHDEVWNRSDDLPTDGGFSRVANRAPDNFVGRSTYPMTDAGYRDQATLVRNRFDGRDYFGRGWWGRRDGWWYQGWGDSWAWGYGGWGDLAPFMNMEADSQPVYYDYGQNITYQGTNVYYGSQPLESTDAYYQQAQSLASQGSTAQSKPSGKEWKSLGVFSVVQNGQSNSSSLFEIAVNKRGQLKGNYYNTITDELKPLTGSVDKKNSRVAWTVAGNSSVVYDTGLGNLLKDQAPLLVHFSKAKTEQYMLVRLHQSVKK